MLYFLGLTLRSTLFYVCYIVLFIWFGSTGQLVFHFFSYRIRARYTFFWNYLTILLLRYLCGVRYQVIGAEHLPDRPYVALAKHESQWETIFLPYFLAPIAVTLKKSLLNIPFFGWGLRLIDPIAIDRGDAREALTMIRQQGQAALKEGRAVLLFPESTRMLPGQTGRYARSGSTLAIAAGVPVVPIALNAGDCWPRRCYTIKPGMISVVVGKPIEATGKTSRELTEQVKTWIETEMKRLRHQ